MAKEKKVISVKLYAECENLKAKGTYIKLGMAENG